MKKAVLQNLALGQQYRIKSTSATQHEGGEGGKMPTHGAV